MCVHVIGLVFPRYSDLVVNLRRRMSTRSSEKNGIAADLNGVDVHTSSKTNCEDLANYINMNRNLRGEPPALNVENRHRY